MIEIICDEYGLYSAEETDLVLTETTQYEAADAAAAQHVKEGRQLRIIIRNPVLFDWADALLRYGGEKYTLSPVRKLADRLQQAVLPDYLQQNPQWIVEVDLLQTAEQHPRQEETTDCWLRKVLIGPVWNSSSPASEDLSLIFSWLLEQDDSSSLPPLVLYLVQQQLTFWGHHSPDYAELFSWLKNNPFKRAKYLVWEQLLFSYPAEKRAVWLHQENVFYELSCFPNRDKLPPLAPNTWIPESIAVFVRSFLAEQWDEGPEQALSFLSGRLEFEEKFLQERLTQQLRSAVALPLSTCDKLLALSNFPEVLALAQQLRPVQEPSLLLPNSSVDRVREWVAHEYLPFYASCALLSRLNATEPYIQAFEDWLQQHYKKMLFESGMAYQQTARLRSCIKKREPVLLCVFDGLDYLSACEEFLPIMEEHKRYPADALLPYFSFLPTQTPIAKPVLIGGRMQEQLPDEKPTTLLYKKILQDYLSVAKDAIRSATDRDATLLELIQEGADVYLYLDNFLDRELLHTSLRQYIRKRKYAEHLQKRALEIVQCLKDFREFYGTSLQLVVCSDHGYTVLPENAPVLDLALSHEVKTRTAHRIVPADPEDRIPQDQQQVWTLPADLYGLRQDMMIPRGYSCFGRKSYGATHGGCTPQEMAVPWFFLTERTTETMQPLDYTLEGEIYRKRDENPLTLNLSNPNAYPVTVIELALPQNLQKDVRIISSFPLNLKENTPTEVEILFDASGVLEQKITFLMNCRLKSVAGELEQELSVTVPTTGAMSTEFDDDFEF